LTGRLVIEGGHADVERSASGFEQEIQRPGHILL
jgi:hypothetical protein